MALDYLAFNKIIKLFKKELFGGRISKISQLSNEEFLFIIRNNNQNYQLLISTHPNMSYMNIVSRKPDGNHVTSNLLMLFRKHLEGGKIENIEQQNDDRIVLFTINSKDDYFNENIKKLYVELIGRASNMILCDENNKIIDSLKKIPLEYSNLRTIQAGITYTLPFKPEKTDIPYDVANEMEYRAISYEDVIQLVDESDQIFITIKDKKKDFHFFPFTFMQGEAKAYKWNEGLDEFYGSSILDERHRQYTSDLEKLVKNELKKNEKKVVKLKEELQTSKEATIYKYYGDLLLTYCQGTTIRQEKVEILDEEKNEKVVIKYDPLYDVYKNANMYYKKYQKSKVAVEKIQEQIDICISNIEYFETLKYQLSNADMISANQIRDELIVQGYFKKYHPVVKTNNKKNKKSVVKVYKPATYILDGVKICVGGNNLQNEYLTFKMADKSHMFFHVQQGPGAHVVVMSDKLDEKLIRAAANLAAYFSSASCSSSVAVNYTLVKNIKKIPGGKPGKVIITNQKTIYIDPNKMDVDRLTKLD